MNSSEILKYLKNPSHLRETTLPFFEQLVRDYPWFQAGWVLYLKNLKNLNDPEHLNLLNRVALRVSDRKRLKSFLDIPGHLNTILQNQEQITGIPDYPIGGKESEEPVMSEKSQLIENFLAHGARFNAPSQDDNQSGQFDLAEKAVAFTDDILTEKFAEILLVQKKYEEAIISFQKLTLKYPEKSVYFAARIEEIRRIMNFK